MNRSARSALALASPSIVWLVIFVAVPCGFMLVMSFLTTGIFGIQFKFTWQNVSRMVDTPLYSFLLFKTFRMAVVTTVVTLVAAFPIALFLSRRTGVTKNLLILLLFLPFWIGYVVRTFAWLPILGRGGLINQILLELHIVARPVEWLLYNEFAVYLGLVYVYLLFMVLPIFLAVDRIDAALYEASRDLGASRWETFIRVLLPALYPALTTGFALTFARAIGEYGSVIFIAGNMPMVSEITPLIIITKLEQYDYAGATAVAVVMLVISFLLLLAINGLQWWSSRRNVSAI